MRSTRAGGGRNDTWGDREMIGVTYLGADAMAYSEPEAEDAWQRIATVFDTHLRQRADG